MTDRNVTKTGSLERTSSTLLERVRQNDQLAWNQLVDVYSPLVCHWCIRCQVSRNDIDDICQDVFRSVYESLGRFRKEKPSDRFRAWLRTITHNKIIDFRRKRREDGRGGTTANEMFAQIAEPAVDGDELELGILMRRAVLLIRGEFEETTWQAFHLRTVEDKSVDAVAAALGVSPNAVYVACSRIRRRMRELLEEVGEASDDSHADD